MKFKQFTKPQFLRSIGRERLQQLFAKFSEDLKAAGLALPRPELDEDAWYTALALLAMAPEGLPPALVETLFVIEEMATAHGQEQLEAAVTDAGLDLTFGEGATHADIAVQVWLADPGLLARQHAINRLSRVSAFEYFSSRDQTDQSGIVRTPSPEVLAAMSAELDAWFRAHNRGHRTTRIDVHEIDEELAFEIRHGDTYTRKMKVDGGKVEVLHFRPARHDLVVYSPQRDEIRIHAGTRGEQELYRRTFGRHLRQNSEHFAERQAYTLEPLRARGMEVLDPDGVAGIKGIGLREVEVAWSEGINEAFIHKADEVFLAALLRRRKPLPETGDIVRAVFEVRFADAEKTRRFEVRPPNRLKLTRQCDARLIHRWLADQGFRRRVSENAMNPGGRDVATVALP
jgi:hypothetical protein